MGVLAYGAAIAPLVAYALACVWERAQARRALVLVRWEGERQARILARCGQLQAAHYRQAGVKLYAAGVLETRAHVALRRIRVAMRNALGG